ncbi:MAG: glycosyltransferase, partial [Lachnospiraceae bacterium]|nr:glycosyltransferase [Lachnospiraceae bacterium]
MNEKLYLVVPCYNEEDVLPISVELFQKSLQGMIKKKKISAESRILFVDDGSNDRTWELITEYSEKNETICGIRLSRNRG